jgi:hypothetical protein
MDNAPEGLPFLRGLISSAVLRLAVSLTDASRVRLAFPAVITRIPTCGPAGHTGTLMPQRSWVKEVAAAFRSRFGRTPPVVTVISCDVGVMISVFKTNVRRGVQMLDARCSPRSRSTCAVAGSAGKT